MSAHTWQRASDRATVCTTCGTVHLTTAGRGGDLYLPPVHEVDRPRAPDGAIPACEIGALTPRRLATYAAATGHPAPQFAPATADALGQPTLFEVEL